MTGLRNVSVPEGSREAVRVFIAALERYWLSRTGTRLSQRVVAGTAHVRPQYVQRVYNGEIGLPPDLLRLLLGEGPTEGKAAIGEAYLTAYRGLYPAHALKWIEELVHPVAASDHGADVLARATEATMLEANRLVGTRTTELFLRDLYVRRRFTGSREVQTETELLEARCGTASITVIVGEPGTGKTSVLWQLNDRLRHSPGRTAWLVAAGEIGSAVPIADVVGALRSPPPGEKPPVLLLDTVDLLLRSEQFPPVLDEVMQTCSAAGAALVMTCRPREFDVLRRHAKERKYEILELGLGPYSDRELPAAVEKHAKHFLDGRFDPSPITRAVLTAVARGLPIAKICQVPLTLRMLFELHQLEHTGDQPVETEIDVTDLFEKYWRLRVAGDARTNQMGTAPDLDLSTLTESLAVVMLAAGTPRIGDADTRMLRRIEGLLDHVETLVRRSVVHEVGNGQREFFHQTFFEYAVARAIVVLGAPALDALVARTLARPDDAFLGAVTQQTLVYACRSILEAAVADKAFATLLDAADTRVRPIAVAAYAQARHRDPRTTAAGRRLLATGGKRLAVHYLINVVLVRRVAHADLGAVLEDLELIWKQYDDVKVRAGVFGALRSLAVVRREPIIDALDNAGAPYLAWYLQLPQQTAQLQRRPVIELLGELAPASPTWCAERLKEVAGAAIRKDGAQDGMVAVLTVAAECRFEADRLRSLLAVIPENVRKDPSGANELGLVAAGIIRQIWMAEDTDPVAIAEDFAGDVSPHASGLGWSPPAWLAGPARLRALAELACDQDPAVADKLVTILLSVAHPQIRTEIGNHFLKHLLGGHHRVRLPGAPEPCDTAATKTAWRRCTEALRSPEPAPSRERSDKALWRDALYAGYLPPAKVAGLVAEVVRGKADPGWLDVDQLAALVVPAALGGIRSALAALAAWSGRGAHSPGPPELRKVLMPRLEHLAVDFPEAFDHLLGDAAATSDGAFLDGALTKLAHKRLPLPANFAERVTPVLHTLLTSKVPGTIRDGFAIAARVDHGRIVESKKIVAALQVHSKDGIRDKNALKAVLNVVEVSLEHDAQRWAAPDEFARLDGALEKLEQPGAAPDPALGRRAYQYRRALYCYSGPIGTVTERRNTLNRVRDLVLEPGDHLLLEPVGRLLSRLVAADPDAAAALLVDTSATIERIEVADRTNSWKSRCAFRLRHPIRNVIVRLSYGAWKHTITALAQGNVHVFESAIDVSIREGTEDMVAYLRNLVGGLDLPDDRVETMLRTATTRRQRITGAFSTWLELRDLWLAETR